MDDKTSQSGNELDITAEAITELLFRQNIYPETTAERLSISAAAAGQSIWLASDEETNLLDEVTTRPDFIHKILLPIFTYRQNNQDIASLYQWTNYHGPFTQRELQLIEATMTLDKSISFAEQMRPASQSTDNKIRGTFLKSLIVALTHVTSQAGLKYQHGLSISGSAIEGHVDLSYHENVPPLEFACCSFEQSLTLSNTELTRLQLTGCHCPGLEASACIIKGEIELDSGFSAHGPVDLSSSKIGGVVNVSGGSFRANDPPGFKPALSLKRAELNNDLILGENFHSDGPIDLDGITCHLNVKLKGARLTNHTTSLNDDAFSCKYADIRGSLLIDLNSSIIGTLALEGSEIHGNLELKSSTFQHPINGTTTNSLLLTHCTIGGHFKVSYSSINGRTLLEHCNIKGNCLLNSITTDNKSGITGSTTISIIHSHIEGALSLRESHIKGRTALSESKIGTALDFTATEMENSTEGKIDQTLSLDRLTIGTDLQLGSNFKSKGPIELKHIDIGGSLSFTAGHFHSDVSLDGISIKRELAFDEQTNSKKRETIYGGKLIILNTRAMTLRDNDTSWPSQIIQRNFIYERLSISAPMNAQKRHDWLSRNNRYVPTSYHTAINSLHRAGKGLEANQLAIEKAESSYWNTMNQIIVHPNKTGTTPGPILQKLRFLFLAPLFSLFWLLYGGLLKYGYGVSRIIILASLAYIITTALLQKAEQQNLLMPRDPAISLSSLYTSCTPERGGSWTKCNVTEITPYSSPLYAADLLIPVFNLQQVKDWKPRHGEFFLNLPTPRCLQFNSACTGVKWISVNFGSNFIYALKIISELIGWFIIIGLLFVIFTKTMLNRHARRQ